MILVTVAINEEASGWRVDPNETLLVTGIGKLNSALALSIALREKRAVVNLGTCGSSTLDPGTIVTPTRFLDGTHGPNSPFYSFYKPVGEETSFSCISYDEFAEEIPSNCVVDMEAYALAKTCEVMGVEFICHKIVTDDGGLDDWRASIDSNMRKLWNYYYQNTLPRLIK